MDESHKKAQATRERNLAAQAALREERVSSKLAARLALNGTNAAGSCLYFFNPSISKGVWIRQNRAYFGSIGCHAFYQ